MYGIENRTAKRALACALAAGLIGAASPARAKMGVSTQFVDVVLGGLKPGGTYNLREIKGVPFVVKNSGDGPVTIFIEAVVPEKKFVASGYEPLPDPTWIQVRPDRFRLNAGEPGFADIILSIPEDETLKDRHFMAHIWARTLDTGMLATGVKSSIRFSIGKTPVTLEAEKRAKAMVDLNFDLWPTKLYLKQAKVGRYDSRQEKARFLLTNRAEKEVELVFTAIPWKTSILPLPADTGNWEQVDGKVRFEPESVKLDPLSVAEVGVIMDIPPELEGRKVAFLVQLSLPIGVVVGATHGVVLQVADTGEKPE